MTEAERDRRLRAYPDLLAGLIEAANLLDTRVRMILSLLLPREGCQREDTLRELDEHILIYRAAVDQAVGRTK